MKTLQKVKYFFSDNFGTRFVYEVGCFKSAIVYLLFSVFEKEFMVPKTDVCVCYVFVELLVTTHPFQSTIQKIE